tara:strand:- start:747 stop:980 length:234 start_codon:yes stop_codon:yes gene_type:complete
MDKNKSEKFRKLAKNRVNSATSYLRLIGNLANKGHYEYRDEEVKKILLHLRKELDRLQAKFKAEKKSNTDEEFDFDG